MIQSRILFLFLLVIVPLAMFAQHGGNVIYHGQQNAQLPSVVPGQFPTTQQADFNSYTFNVHALYNAEAAAYVAIFNVVQLGATAEEADRLVSNRVKALTEDLKQLAIPESSIRIDMISQIAIYEYQVEKKPFSKDNYLEIPKGIELQKNLHITFTKGSLLDKVLTAAAKQEIYDLVKVDYYLDNQDEIYLQLQQEAIAFHQKQKKTYLQLGVRLDTARVAFSANTSVHYPIDRYLPYQSTSSSSLKNVKDESGVQEVRKPNTFYYAALPANGYEVVINPVIKEPMVQIAYTLSIRYYFPPAPTVQVQTEVVNQKEFLILTPDGVVRPLTIVTEK
ncbi:MAG: SIMPL domain-containing protein [Bacteroidia bacterium]|nr:SIMPL domain-containing protein [Bacteroidia bacterium]